MAKSMVVTLPFVLLLLDYWPFERFSWEERRRLPQLLLEKTPFFLMSVAVAIVTVLAQSEAIVSTEHVSLLTRIGNAFLSYAAYLGRMVVPVRLAVVYPYHAVATGPAIAAALLFVALTAGALIAGRRRRYLAVGWLWFAGTLVPVIGLVQVGLQAMADRFTYIPSIGIFIAVTWLVADLAARNLTVQRAAIALALAAILVYAGMARVQTGYWQNSLTLFQHAVEVTTHNALARNNLGSALMDDREYEKARVQYQAAERISPGNAISLYGLGLVQRAEGNVAEATRYFKAALASDPKLNEARRALGEAELAAGNAAGALEALRAAVAADPDDARARGTLLLAQNDLNGAISAYEEAVRREPGDAHLENNLAAALAKAGRDAEALEHYLAALRLDPTLYDGHMNVGALLSRKGRDAEALAHFADASRLHPSSPEPLVYLALLHSNQGKYAEAADEIDRAISVDEQVANQILTNAIHMPFKETNVREYSGFLHGKK
jgi:tetratricopeptide (TPR) repeat protein